MTSQLAELRKFVAPEFLYGVGAAAMVSQYARNYSLKHCLVVTDPGVRRAGWVDPVLERLADAGVRNTVYDQVSPNPRDHEVMRGVDIYRNEGCDAIVAVGGGSPMDCAKGIGIAFSNNRHILEFEGVDNVEIPGPPLICLPTTAGSSADVSQFAIITDTRRRVKIAIVSKTTVPDVALIDPELTSTMQAELTAATGLDALTHAVEAYVSTANSHVTDMFALRAIQGVRGHLLQAIAEPDNLHHRECMTLASMDAGLAFSNAILGAVHAMAHSLGGLIDAPHGDCNALLLPYVVEANFDAAPERYREVARAFGLAVDNMQEKQIREELVSALLEFKEQAGIQERLRDLGVRVEDIPAYAANAVKDPCMLTNPRQLNEEEVAHIYEQAL